MISNIYGNPYFHAFGDYPSLEVIYYLKNREQIVPGVSGTIPNLRKNMKKCKTFQETKSTLVQFDKVISRNMFGSIKILEAHNVRRSVEDGDKRSNVIDCPITKVFRKSRHGICRIVFCICLYSFMLFGNGIKRLINGMRSLVALFAEIVTFLLSIAFVRY